MPKSMIALVMLLDLEPFGIFSTRRRNVTTPALNQPSAIAPVR